MSNQLLCWSSIIKFKDYGVIPANFLAVYIFKEAGVAGRAWLLYQKFIGSDSYIQVKGISEEKRSLLADQMSSGVAKEIDNLNDSQVKAL